MTSFPFFVFKKKLKKISINFSFNNFNKVNLKTETYITFIIEINGKSIVIFFSQSVKIHVKIDDFILFVNDFSIVAFFLRHFCPSNNVL